MPETKLTAERLRSIPDLLRQGLRRKEIAELIGVTESTLQVQCSRKGISLRPDGPRERKPLYMETTEPLPLTKRTMEVIREAAEARGKTNIELAARLLETIAKDDLFEAVLDDADV
jgi:transposase